MSSSRERAGARTVVEERLREAMRVRVEVEIVSYGTLPRSEGESRRVVDVRFPEDAGNVS